jgi:hypothetical protein
MTNKFSVGDRVSFGGLRGKVIDDALSKDYPINVTFDSGHSLNFTNDGLYILGQTKPLLKKLKKKKSDKVREIWVNLHYNEHSDEYLSAHFTKDEAIKTNRAIKELAVRFVRAKRQ